MTTSAHPVLLVGGANDARDLDALARACGARGVACRVRILACDATGDAREDVTRVVAPATIDPLDFVDRLVANAHAAFVREVRSALPEAIVLGAEYAWLALPHAELEPHPRTRVLGRIDAKRAPMELLASTKREKKAVAEWRARTLARTSAPRARRDVALRFEANVESAHAKNEERC